jgi:hypothetical protein
MRARILRAHSQEPALRRTTDDAEIGRPADHLRKERDDLDVHGEPS